MLRANCFRTLLWLTLACALACQSDKPEGPPPGTLIEIASSPELQWTGVAVAPDKRIFACFPRWNEPYRYAVAHVRGAEQTPYPDAEWNQWSPGTDPSRRFVCVQSVHVDSKGKLWVLDAGSPRMEGVVLGAPKLVGIDLAKNAVVDVIPFDSTIATPQSYFNDVRVDPAHSTAYITDSGAGAIVVVDLTHKRARRLLDGHSAVLAEELALQVGGRELRLASGAPLRVNCDGIALDPTADVLYWQALTGRTLYSIRTSVLRDTTATPAVVAAAVRRIGETVGCDGMATDAKGNLFFSAIERDAIVVRKTNGTLENVVQDSQLAWPDSLAFGPDGRLYVTTSQIHRSRWFDPSSPWPAEPFKIYAIVLPRM